MGRTLNKQGLYDYCAFIKARAVRHSCTVVVVMHRNAIVIASTPSDNNTYTRMTCTRIPYTRITYTRITYIGITYTGITYTRITYTRFKYAQNHIPKIRVHGAS